MLDKTYAASVSPSRNWSSQQEAKYQHIIIFIYDASASVQEHIATRDALRRIPGVYDVMLVSRPSQLAEPAERKQKGKGR